MAETGPAAPSSRQTGAAGEFDIAAAAFHVFQHANRRGWRTPVVLAAIFCALNLAFGAAVFASFPPIAEFMDADPDEVSAMEMAAWFSRMIGVICLVMLGQVIVYSTMDALLLRWFFGRDGAGGDGPVGDVLRLVVVWILWLLLALAIFLPAPLLIGVGVATESAGLGLLGGLLLLGAFAVWLLCALRLAPAAALSVFDRRVRFASAWGATRGVALPMLGAFVIVWAINFAGSIAMQALAQPFFLFVGGEAMAPVFNPAATGAEPDPERMIEAMTAPPMVAVFLIAMTLSALVQFLLQAMLAGVNAWRVKTLRGAA